MNRQRKSKEQFRHGPFTIRESETAGLWTVEVDGKWWDTCSSLEEAEASIVRFMAEAVGEKIRRRRELDDEP